MNVRITSEDIGLGRRINKLDFCCPNQKHFGIQCGDWCPLCVIRHGVVCHAPTGERITNKKVVDIRCGSGVVTYEVENIANNSD